MPGAVKRDELTLRSEFERMDREYMGKHDFLGKDLLTMPNKISSSRILMFSQHLEQAVVLDNPEFPKVFTGYENQVGKYSSSYMDTEEELKVIRKIKKFPWLDNSPYYLLVKNKDKQYEIIARKESECLTEVYGYKYDNSGIDSFDKGDKIPKGTTLYKSKSFDKYGNYCYGVNAKCVYLLDNRVIEDAFVISESFAKRLSSIHVDEVEINVNSNDILCNIYNDKDKFYGGYKMFPDIGESTKGKILVSRRRINNDFSLYDLKNESLNNINYQNDTIFYGSGKVVDLQIYCNSSIEELKKYQYNNQIVKYLENQMEFNNQINSICEKILSKGNTLGPDLSYLYKRTKATVQEGFQWTSQKEFDNVILVFQLEQENPIGIGSKLSARYGNKGCIDKILPDEQMPVLDNGVRAEIIFNALSVINRLGSAPLYEIELNFCSDEIVSRMKSMRTLEDREKIFFKYLKMVNKDYYKFIKSEYENSNKEKYLKKVMKDGIYLLQPPFFGNIKFEQLEAIYDEFDIKPRQATMDGKPIMQPLFIADQYMIKLKHDPSGKMSARSCAQIDIRNRPSKSLAFKKHTSLISTTPIRLGEMEINNLLLCNDSKAVAKMMSSMSSSEGNRHILVDHLLNDPIEDEVDNIELPKIDNYNRDILDVIFKSLGMRISTTESNSKK